MKAFFSLLPLALVLCNSCEEFIQVPPPKTQLVSESIFASDKTATAAVAGIYGQMMESPNTLFNGAITFYAGLSADEMITAPNNQSYNEFFTNNINPANTNNEALWSGAYSYIYQANAAIEGLAKTEGVVLPLKKQLTAEALFIRALCHFYMVNFFGEIPVVTTTSYQDNAQLKKAPISEVYAQITGDLNESIQLFAQIAPSADKTRPGKYAATALLSRVALYQGDWAKAESLSNELITNGSYALEQDLSAVFAAGSAEAIWQLMPVSPSVNNTGEGYMFIQESGLPVYGSLDQVMMAQFENGDLRRTAWTYSYTEGATILYYPFKYRVKTASSPEEYYVVFRLSEQYLIRAEALIKLGNLNEAIKMLDAVRTRAGLPLIADVNSSANAEQLMPYLMQERRSELFAEWGHRWFDLKRWSVINDVLSVKENWQATDQLYPIPLKQIQNDPAMASAQNPGY